MKKIITVFLILCMFILAGCNSSSETTGSIEKESKKGYQITEISKFDNPSSGTVAVENGKLLIHDDSYYKMLSETGKQTGSIYYAVDELDTEGYLAVVSESALSASDTNFVGLVGPDGKEIIPCEAAYIQSLNYSTRFVEVYYATEKTTENDEECFFGLYPKTNEMDPTISSHHLQIRLNITRDTL